MAKLTSRGFTATEDANFRARAVQPHTVQWKANSYLYVSGTPTLLMENIPIVNGRLTLDSSDPIRRQLTLEVGGGEATAANDFTDPLVPFGQVIFLWVRIDFADGTWSPWLKMGEYPIVSYVFEQPSQVATVDAADYAYAVDEYLHLSAKSYKNMSLLNAVVQMVGAALPNNAFAVYTTDAARTSKILNYAAEAGSGRWATVLELCAIKGHEAFFDSLGNLILRRDVTDDNDETIPGVGPDIGTATSPVATIRDGEGGNLVASTATVTREGGCNAVAINLHGTADTNKKKKGIQEAHRQILLTVDSGPVTWGDRFGRVPIVDERNVKKITAQVVSDHTERAKRLLHRRRGVVRYIDLDAAGLYWLEPDDKVRIRWGHNTTSPREEAHYAQRVEFDLTGRSPVRIRTRQLSVTDPG